MFCEIATAPSGPRNDKLVGIAPPNYYRNTCNCLRRSLSAATDAIGACHFNGGLYGLPVQRRARLSASLQRALPSFFSKIMNFLQNDKKGLILSEKNRNI